MGKLHKLRRAIERDPAKWRQWSNAGASWWKKASGYQWDPYWSSNSYAKFVAHVLRNIPSGRHVR